MKRLCCLALLVAAWASGPAYAHKPSDSYLRVLTGPAAESFAGPEAGPLAIRWDLSLRDLDFLVGLDADADGSITWGELKDKRDGVAAATLSRLSVVADDRPLTLRLEELRVTEHSDGTHAVLTVGTDAAAAPDRVRVTYRLLFDADPTHRGLLFFDDGVGAGAPVILSPEASVAEARIGDAGGSAAAFAGYVAEGVHHIWIGLDHVLFLLTLLLPAVLTRNREERRWEPAASFRAAAGRVLAVVTAFTLSHSITLWLATTGLVSPPSWLMEASIAASILVCCVHNLAPRFVLSGVGIAFVFGLLHGFGFAGVLADLGLFGRSLLAPLLGFNLGVELGQLAIVAVFLPLAWLLRDTAFYRRVVLQGGSVAVALLAAVWIVERVLDVAIVGL